MAADAYTAKDLRVAPISRADADRVVRLLHYSGKVVPNSQLHLGVFLGDRLEGAMQFGPSMDKRKTLGLVRGTPWNGFLELNRMAFSDRLPRNSESRKAARAYFTFRSTSPAYGLSMITNGFSLQLRGVSGKTIELERSDMVRDADLLSVCSAS